MRYIDYSYHHLSWRLTFGSPLRVDAPDTLLTVERTQREDLEFLPATLFQVEQP